MLLECKESMSSVRRRDVTRDHLLLYLGKNRGPYNLREYPLPHVQAVRLTLNSIEVSCTAATESEREPPNDRNSLSQGAGIRPVPSCSACSFHLRGQWKIPIVHGKAGAGGVVSCVNVFQTIPPLSNSSVICP